jgi:hypothetical protein
MCTGCSRGDCAAVEGDADAGDDARREAPRGVSARSRDRYHARGYSSCEFVLRMTREEIGSYLGLKLETVSGCSRDSSAMASSRCRPHRQAARSVFAAASVESSE